MGCSLMGMEHRRHAVTYCSTSPSLCVLEKLVHIEDASLLPELIGDIRRSRYARRRKIDLEDLADEWRRREAWTQQGERTASLAYSPLIRVPSAIVPIPNSPDVNVLINHTHPACANIKISRLEPFIFDPRLF